MLISDIIPVVYRKLLGELEKIHDWFTKHKKKSCNKPILWLSHVCTHSYIYSNILFFNKCTLMKTTTSADGCLIQLKVLTWIYSWLFFFLTVSSLWGSEAMRKLLSWLEFCQGGRIFAEVEAMKLLWRRGGVYQALQKADWKSLKYFFFSFGGK